MAQLVETLNRWIATALFVLGFCFVGFGLYLGFFAWINDGAKAGLRLLLLTLAFGAGFAAAGLVFRFTARAHARSDPRRWWIQVLAVAVAYFAIGLAAWASSLLDRI